jgi:hypothetical protein
MGPSSSLTLPYESVDPHCLNRQHVAASPAATAVLERSAASSGP